MVHGGTKISVMEPGTLVRPHTGTTNARMRIHLGLSVPKGVGVRVDGEARTWVEGKCIVFDDSYASRAVQFHPHGGQSDFVWLSARTPRGAYVW